MTIDKITNAPTPNEQIDKINELIDNKQDKLISGTNIKTINNESILGSGDITISGGESDVFIAEYGVTTFNEVLTAYNAGKIIYCNSVIFANLIEMYNGYAPLTHIGLIDNTDNIENFYFDVTINGSTGTCITYISLNVSTGWASNWQGLGELVTSISSSSTNIQYPSAKCVYDETKNKETTSNKVTSISSNSTNTQYPSAKCVYDKLALKQDTTNKVTSISSSSTDTEYPSAKSVIELLKTIYPVGSVYLSTNSTCPMASLFGTWTLVTSGRALWTGDGTNGNTTIAAGLPNISGSPDGFRANNSYQNMNYGAFTWGTIPKTSGGSGSGSYSSHAILNFSATDSNSIYGKSTTVQPPAYVVNVWRRTA